MRRETVLLGLAALPLAGCAAVRDRVRGAVNGCVDAAVRPGLDLFIVSGPIASRHVPGGAGYSVAFADDVNRRTIDGAIYLLPGRGGTARDALNALGFAGVFSAAIRSNVALRRTALVAVDAGETYFHARASGEDRLALVTEELPAILQSITGVRPRREALIGQSMGGYGALLAAERAPSRFRSVAVAGPALFVSYEDEHRSVGDAFDDAADFARNDVIGHAPRLRGVPVMVRCGDHDPFTPAVKAFAKRCPSADVRIVSGCHTDGFWRATAAELLRFTAAHL